MMALLCLMSLFGRGDWHIGRQTLARSGCDRGLEIRRIIEGSSRTEASASLVKCRAGRAGQQLPVVDVGGRGGSPAACRYADCRGVDACVGQSWLCAPGFMGGDCRGRCSPIRGELAPAPSWRDVRRDVLGLVRQRDALSWRHLVSSCGRLRRRSTVSERVSRRSAHTLSVACRLTQELGTPLAEVLDIVADSIDEAAAAEDARAIARSGPLTSARILTALPVAGIALGQLIGANPLERFCDGGIGTISAIIGTVCLIVGRLVSTRMITRTIDISESVDPATMCDLTIAGMNAGASVPSIVRTLGRVGNDAELERIGSELVLGARWGDAWNPHPANAALLADVLEPAWSDGTSPVPLLTRAARQVRARRIAHAKSEAERLAVRLVIPLGALLLPSFIALGVVPILLHIGTNTFGGLW